MNFYIYLFKGVHPPCEYLQQNEFRSVKPPSHSPPPCQPNPPLWRGVSGYKTTINAFPAIQNNFVRGFVQI